MGQVGGLETLTVIAALVDSLLAAGFLSCAGKGRVNHAAMTRIAGVVLMVLGGFLIFRGWSRHESLAGGAATLASKVANKVDGGGRVPDHVYYLAGGGVAVVAGAILALRPVRG